MSAQITVTVGGQRATVLTAGYSSQGDETDLDRLEVTVPPGTPGWAEVTVTTPDVDFPELDDVDAKLLKLAKDRGLRILTTDFNLNRLARIQDVVVLNVNELANALKPAVLPGESFDVRVIREGKEHDQGVGYLDDGTMVVVEGGRRMLGETTAVEVTSVLQSPSGKMIFTKVSSSPDGE